MVRVRYVSLVPLMLRPNFLQYSLQFSALLMWPDPVGAMIEKENSQK